MRVNGAGQAAGWLSLWRKLGALYPGALCKSGNRTWGRRNATTAGGGGVTEDQTGPYRYMLGRLKDGSHKDFQGVREYGNTTFTPLGLSLIPFFSQDPTKRLVGARASANYTLRDCNVHLQSEVVYHVWVSCLPKTLSKRYDEAMRALTQQHSRGQ